MKNKKHHEGFKPEQIEDIVSKKEAYILKFRNFVEKGDELKKLFREIRNYDFSGFDIKYRNSNVRVYPDKGFYDLVEKVALLTNQKIDIPYFQLQVTELLYNLIDFENGVPEPIRGSSTAYKIYKEVCIHYKYISSDKNASKTAINLWYSFLQDNDLYCVTSNFFSYAIYKGVDDEFLRNVLEQIKNRKEQDISNVLFDDDLTKKIIEIYGSMDIYKQRN